MKRSPANLVQMALPWLLLIVLLALPVVGLSANMMRLLFITAVWTITSVGWNLIGGVTGQVSFGFAVFYGLGAYTTALLINSGRGAIFALAGAAAIAVMASFLVGLPTFRLRGPYFAIATIGVTEAVRVVMNNLEFSGGASGYRVNETGEFNPLHHYYSAIGVAAAAVAISSLVLNSGFGLALRSIKEDQDAASDVGVNIYACKLWVHAIAAGLTGIAGGIFARYAAFFYPDGVFAFQTGISILLMPVIGGIGTIWGPVLGGIVFGMVEEQLTAGFEKIHLLLYGLLLILIILFEPDGLVGLFRRLVKLFRRNRGDSGSQGTDEVLWGRSRLEGREL